jgi:hypothetical protein
MDVYFVTFKNIFDLAFFKSSILNYSYGNTPIRFKTFNNGFCTFSLKGPFNYHLLKQDFPNVKIVYKFFKNNKSIFKEL